MMKSYSDKRILVAGAGGVGSFYGSLMTKAGLDAELLGRGKHLDEMVSSGVIHMKSFQFGETDIPVNPTAEPKGMYDIIFLCVKAHDTARTALSLKDHLKTDGCIVSLQNGVENPDILVSIFGKERVIASSVFLGAWVAPAGTINHMARGDIAFGAWEAEAKVHEPAVKSILDAIEIKNRLRDDMKRSVWTKLIWNVVYNPLSALLQTTCGPMIRSKELSPLLQSMAEETTEAARLSGADIAPDEWRKITEYSPQMENYKTSMLVDIEKQRKPEIDGILGPVVRTLESNGKKAPHCESVLRMLEFKYGSHFIYCPRLTVDMVVTNGGQLLLVERKNEPHGWALPGGFVDYGERVEDAAVRELSEETGIDIAVSDISLLGVYSDPERDRRGHTVSVVYSAESNQMPKAGDDAKNAVFFDIKNLPENIVFDHKKIISDKLS